MPRAPVFTRSPTLGNVRGANPSLVNTGPGIAAAGRQLAGGIARLGREEQRRQERQRRKSEMAEGFKTLGDFRVEQLEELKRRQDEAEEGAPDFAEGFIKDHDERVNTILEGASQGARDVLIPRLASLKGSLASNAIAFEGVKRAQKNARDLDGAARAGINAARTDETMIGEVLADIDDLAEQSGLKGANRVEARRLLRGRAAVAHFQGLNERDPEQAADQLDDGRFDNLLTPEQKNTLVNDNQVELRRLDRNNRENLAKVRAEARLLARDALAEVRATGRNTTGLSFDRIRATFDEAEANRLIENLIEERDGFEVRARVALTDPKEDREILDAERGKVGGAGFVSEAGRFALLQNAIAAKQKALAADNAGYAAQASPAVAGALSAALEGNDPDAMENYAALIDQTQGDLGVPRSQRRLLPKTVAAGFASDVASQPNAAGQADRLAGLEDLFGPAWPRAAAEMHDEGLPPGAVVLAGMNGPGQRGARVRLAEALDTGTKKLKDAIGAEAAGAVRAAVRQNTADLAKSLADVPGGPQALVQQRFAIEQLANLYASGGMSTADAARTAANEVVNNRYVYDGSLRIPLAAFPLTADRTEVRDTVRLVTDETVRDLDAFDIQPPPSVFGDVGDDFLRGQYVAALRADHKWIVNGDETGVILIDGLGNVPLVKSPDGPAPIEILFETIQGREAGTARPPQPFRLQSGPARGRRRSPGELATQTRRGQPGAGP